MDTGLRTGVTSSTEIVDYNDEGYSLGDLIQGQYYDTNPMLFSVRPSSEPSSQDMEGLANTLVSISEPDRDLKPNYHLFRE